MCGFSQVPLLTALGYSPTLLFINQSYRDYIDNRKCENNLKNFFYSVGDFILLPALLVGGVILIAVFLGKCDNDSSSPDSVSNEIEYSIENNSNSQDQSFSTKPYDTTTQHHQEYIQESKRKAELSKECKFDIAYKTALKFLDKKSLTLVRESNNRQENPNNCSVSYGFYVRLNEYNSLTQEMELSDKVYLVSMHLTKYNDFYSVDLADLIDEVNMKQRSLL